MRFLPRDISNQRFGNLVAIKSVGKTKHGLYRWLCKCDCGNEKIVVINNLTSGHTKSCGCYVIKSRTTHGLSKTKIYRVYYDIIQRCYNADFKEYENYGGRGIEICAEWHDDFMNFYNWAIANGYKEGLTIDRIDVDRNYEPSNCRWVTMAVQQNNKRNNHYITYKGETHSIRDWERICGFGRGVIQSRINNGWNIERAMTEPIHNKKQDKVQMPYKDGKTIHDIETRFITEDNQMKLSDFI